jgi:type I restriction enzyme S subunit
MSTAILHNEKKKILVPQLRFQEFEGEWNIDEIGNTCIVKTGGSDTQDRIENGMYPFFVRSNTVERINKFSFNGEAILTSGDGVGVGRNFHYINGKFDYHQRVYALREFRDGYSGKFIYHFFSEKFYKRVIKLSAKNSVDSVRMNMITEMKIAIPTLPEQQKIASFLSAVDEKKQQLTRKATLLEQYKKGVMQQLFSYKIRLVKEGQLRRGCLGDFGFFYYGKGAPKTSVFKDAKTPCVRYGELYSTYKEEIKKIKSYTNIDPKELKLSKGGEVLVPRVGEDPRDFANCSYLPFPNVAIGEMISVYNTDEDGLFMTYYINAMLKKQLAKLVEGGNVSNLYFRYVETIEIEIPSKEEQEKIVKFLKALDSKIEKVNQQLAQTQTFKKGLLQQMFV